jgi:hypothetical protein
MSEETPMVDTLVDFVSEVKPVMVINERYTHRVIEENPKYRSESIIGIMGRR